MELGNDDSISELFESLPPTLLLSESSSINTALMDRADEPQAASRKERSQPIAPDNPAKPGRNDRTREQLI